MLVAEAGALSRVLPIVNTKGLHARASAKFVQCAAKFDAQVMVSKDGSSVSATSIMGLMMLGAGIGSEISIVATGREAVAALDALQALVAGKFGEDS
ncbi:MAG: HPr family phosphocarrier protein [Alphaproteobacteria bacterium]|nr:HPr family phosphocarrier protein [Alphaproteobacteria bacterium]